MGELFQLARLMQCSLRGRSYLGLSGRELARYFGVLTAQYFFRYSIYPLSYRQMYLIICESY